MTTCVLGRDSTWRSGLLRAGLPGRRIGLRTTGGSGAAAATRLIYRPSRPMGRVAALFDQTAARLSVGPRVENPLAGLESLPADFLADADSAAVIRSSMPGRILAATSAKGSPRHVLKIGRADDLPLRNEAEFLRMIPAAGPPFLVPELLFAGRVGDRYIIVTLAWPRSRPAGPLTRNELLGLTEFIGKSRVGGGSFVHGDLAPWNVLRTPEGLGVVDWEAAHLTDQPLRDLVHYLMQAGAHLRWADVRTVVRELTHPQGMAAELASRLGRPGSLVRDALHEYVAHSPAACVPRVRRFRERVADAAGLPSTP
jgi:hypothetical protein